MVLRENKNNAYAKFGGTDKEYYGIFRNGQLGERKSKNPEPRIRNPETESGNGTLKRTNK